MPSHSGSGKKAIWAKREKKGPLSVSLKSHLWYYLVWFSQVGFYLSTPGREGKESFKGIGMGGVRAVEF